jgi:ADP-heptose:LPS heptosyltransferase
MSIDSRDTAVMHEKCLRVPNGDQTSSQYAIVHLAGRICLDGSNNMIRLRSMWKTIVRELVCTLFDRSPVRTATGPPRHVVVLRWDAKLGDTIVSSPFYREIHKLPGVSVTVVTVAELEEMHRREFSVDRVIVTRAQPGLLELLRVRQQLDAVDVVVHLVGRIQPGEIFFLSRLKAAHVYSLDDTLRLVNHRLGDSTKGLLFADKYVRVLQSLGVPDVQTPYIVPLDTVGAVGISTSDILFNPYGSRVDKSLSPAKAAELLDKLANVYPTFTIGILNKPQTRRAATQLEFQVNRPNVKALDGIETPKHAAAAVLSARVTITVDTAIVHMAVGLRKSLIAIYPEMGSEPNPWLPPASSNTRVIISRHSVQRYELTGTKDMNQFSSSEIIDAVRSLGVVNSPTQPDTVVAARLIRGLGVASGTLSRQLPLIGASFPEVADCHPGTINLQLKQGLQVRHPDHRTPPLAWTPSGRTREVFDLVRVELELLASGRHFPAWLYVAHGSPHRLTPTILEVIARRLDLDGETDCRLHIRSDAIEVSDKELGVAY